MTVVEKFDLFASYHPGYTRKSAPDAITLHGSAGGENAEALFKWWRNIPTAEDEWSKKKVKSMKKGIGFYNYLIDRNGVKYALLPENKWSYNADAGRVDGKAIAICLVNNKKGNLALYTDEQYDSLIELMSDIISRNESIKTIDSHSFRAKHFSNVNPATPCPGPYFEWQRMQGFELEIREKA